MTLRNTAFRGQAARRPLTLPAAGALLVALVALGALGGCKGSSQHQAFAESFNTQSRTREYTQTLPCVPEQETPATHMVKHEKEIIRLNDPYWVVESSVHITNTLLDEDPQGLCTRPADHRAVVRRRFRPGDVRLKRCYDREEARLILLECKDGSNCVSVDGDCNAYTHNSVALFATGTMTCADAEAAFK